jgi:DNA ligase-1
MTSSPALSLPAVNGFDRFVLLFQNLHQTNKTDQKVALMEEFFRTSPPSETVWALWFLCGERFPRPVRTTDLRLWIAEETQFPQSLIEECYEAVGDLAETLALLLEGPARLVPPAQVPELSPPGLTLEHLSLHHLKIYKSLSPEEIRRDLLNLWKSLPLDGRLVLNKLLLGGFRVGAARTLVIRALAQATNLPQALLTHRLLGGWKPSVPFFEHLLKTPQDPETAQNPDESALAAPYPFFLAHQIEVPVETLGPPQQWIVEWKWDGIRGQIVRRGDQTFVWTRGEELVSETYPELVVAGQLLPNGTVLDGEILAWDFSNARPLPFQLLQTRINRLRPNHTLLKRVPVLFMAYDLLESEGQDRRQEPLETRRQRLEQIAQALPANHNIQPSSLLMASSWEAYAAQRAQAREIGTEGLMLKNRMAPYGHGRMKGPWWKWKVQPLTIDAVLIHALAGHGKRASLLTDYTFALWQEGELVPVAKAYSGLTDQEIREVDRFIRNHTIEKKGPFRAVEPALVMELGFDSVQLSNRHRSHVAVRFPRILRWRKDKKIEEADHLSTLMAMVRHHPQPSESDSEPPPQPKFQRKRVPAKCQQQQDFLDLLNAEDPTLP